MTHGHAECTACGHAWELRKPDTEIDVLRCSACDATGDAISVTGTPPDTIDPDEISIVERVELEEHRVELRTRAERITTDIEQLGGGSVPDDLKPAYMALDLLIGELTGEELLAPAELDEIDEYLIEKEEAIYTRDDVTKVTDLDRRVTELTAEIEALRDEKRQLKTFLSHGSKVVSPR